MRIIFQMFREADANSTLTREFILCFTLPLLGDVIDLSFLSSYCTLRAMVQHVYRLVISIVISRVICEDISVNVANERDKIFFCDIVHGFDSRTDIVPVFKRLSDVFDDKIC